MSSQNYQIGDVIGVQEFFYRHRGIWVGNGRVFHASKKRGQNVIDTIHDFSNGKPVQHEGYPSNLSPEEVIHRAHRLIGQPFNLFGDNCEHLVAKVHGLPKQSPQLRQWSAVALAAILVFVVLSRGRVA